jgi:hypothetical protein
MNIEQQIQFLIDHAPQDGATPVLIEVISPALKLFAENLKHLQYYVLQTLEQNWVMTTLSHRTQPDMSKNVIYAFSTLKDASAGPYAKDPQVIAMPVPVIHILFQMVAMQTIDSIVFFEIPGDLNTGTEVPRQELYTQIQQYLQPFGNTSLIPPDIA